VVIRVCTFEIKNAHGPQRARVSGWIVASRGLLREVILFEARRMLRLRSLLALDRLSHFANPIKMNTGLSRVSHSLTATTIKLLRRLLLMLHYFTEPRGRRSCIGNPRGVLTTMSTLWKQSQFLFASICAILATQLSISQYRTDQNVWPILPQSMIC